MAKRSKITTLPPELKQWLDAELVRRGFQDYVQLASDLKTRGGDGSKSSIHRYGSNLERKLAAVKTSTEAARLIAEASPDEADDRSNAVISLTQTGLFNILVDLEEASGIEDATIRAKLLSSVAKNVATLTRASVGLKKYRYEVQQRLQAAADAAAKIGKKGGLSTSGAEQIRKLILGIQA